ncbi:MAG: hypothetical protein GY862_14325 [Gammaproteobacteria bacterium]|nr:hypothetical protein [Gammaproteobacteria bacterium]
MVLDDPQLEQLACKLADRKQQNLKDVLRQALLLYLLDTESDKQIFDELPDIPEAMDETSPNTPFVAQLPVTKQFDTPEQQKMFEDAMRIARHCASLPVLDNRSADEIPGYNEHGYFD